MTDYQEVKKYFLQFTVLYRENQIFEHLFLKFLLLLDDKLIGYYNY